MMKTKQMTCYGDLGLHVTQGTLFCLEEYAEHFFTLALSICQVIQKQSI